MIRVHHVYHFNNSSHPSFKIFNSKMTFDDINKLLQPIVFMASTDPWSSLKPSNGCTDLLKKTVCNDVSMFARHTPAKVKLVFSFLFTNVFHFDDVGIVCTVRAIWGSGVHPGAAA